MSLLNQFIAVKNVKMITCMFIIFKGEQIKMSTRGPINPALGSTGGGIFAPPPSPLQNSVEDVVRQE